MSSTWRERENNIHDVLHFPPRLAESDRNCAEDLRKCELGT